MKNLKGNRDEVTGDCAGPTALRMNGKEMGQTIRNELAARVEGLAQKYRLRPGLGVILVGDRKDSQAYVRMKKSACKECGIESFEKLLPADVTQKTLLNVIREMNRNPLIHGILVQLPLPVHINENEVLEAIQVEKDVDGLHPINIAQLCTFRQSQHTDWKAASSEFNIPCTPKGCIELLDRYNIPIEGKNAVVLGRSKIVGIPMSLLLMHRNATVTICHSRTVDVKSKVREADIVVAAVGIPNFVQGEWIKPGATVIDVGINSVDDPSRKQGYRLVGDVSFADTQVTAGAITPVPGGVGPMTIAMLLANTVQSFERIQKS